MGNKIIKEPQAEVISMGLVSMEKSEINRLTKMGVARKIQCTDRYIIGESVVAVMAKDDK